MIQREGPDTVAAVFLEPVQNAGGCFPPPPGYFERVREICDEYDVLLVSDEVICAYGRIGDMFACNDFGYVPDIITSAKGITSGYAPLGAMIASDRLFEPFGPGGDATFYHGYTFGGHPVACAAAMANFDVFENEKLNDHGAAVNEYQAILALEPRDEKALLPAVGDINLHFYDIDGHPVSYPGSELLVRPTRALLTALPTSIAMAAGERKAPSILAGARAGLYTTLLTDEPTAQAVLALAASMD